MKHNRLAAIVWLSQIQYFIVQTVVAVAWERPFSLRTNTISDLGNTTCGPYGDRFVCSPLHGAMNISFMALGIATLGGALLLMHTVTRRKHRVGLGLMAIGGIGTIIVGLFPENSMGPFHALGASLPFVLGNIALLLLADLAPAPTWLKRATYVAATIALISLGFFVTGADWLLGNGGFERVTAYVQTIWMISFAAVLLRRNK